MLLVATPKLALIPFLGLVFSVSQAEAQEVELQPHDASVWDVPAVGPGLTIGGGSAFLVGAAVSGAGAAIRRCSGRTCTVRTALLWGGAGFSGLLGGLGLGIGTSVWRSDLGQASRREEDSAPRADPTALGVGIPLVILGSCSYAVGLVGTQYVSSDSSGADFGFSGASAASLLVLGAAGMAVGIPMTHLGNRRLPPEQQLSADVVLAPGTVGLRGEFW